MEFIAGAFIGGFFCWLISREFGRIVQRQQKLIQRQARTVAGLLDENDTLRDLLGMDGWDDDTEDDEDGAPHPQPSFLPAFSRN